jgi:hypothetical protein
MLIEQNRLRTPARRSISLKTLLVDWLLPAWFLAYALFFALTTLCAILNYAPHQPTFDQYVEYGKYLSQPFVTSVLAVENGHHPVFPALIANLEISWFDANQYLQLTIGTLCIFLALAAITWTVSKQDELPRVARAAGVMLATLGVLWLANARMLLQSVGQLQIYLVVLSVLIAIWCTWRAARKDSWLWIAGAATACLVAMFTFGTGVASFPTVIGLGVLMRMRWQKLLFLLLSTIVCLVLYVFILPGHQGVQNSLALRPLDSLVTAAQWLSSPWANAFLGLADPPLQPWLPGSFDGHVGPMLWYAANGLERGVGISWQSISTVLGFVGILAFVIRLAFTLLRGVLSDRYETLANGLCLFGLITAVVISIGRLDYFQAIPNQVFADRYLAWPCLFWTGLALLLLRDACRLKNRALSVLGLIFLVAPPIVLHPTHRAWAGWGAAIYQMSQRSAAAARSDVFDESVFAGGDDASRQDVLLTLSLLKKNRLAMFTDPGWELMGLRRTPEKYGDEIAVSVRVVNPFHDALTGLPAARVEGEISHGIGSIAEQDQLAVLDEDDRVVGLMEFSSIKPDGHALRLSVPRKSGFDGYIRDYHAGQTYRLVLLQLAEKRSLLLKNLVADAAPK